MHPGAYVGAPSNCEHRLTAKTLAKCKRICKRTTQHSTARGVTNQAQGIGNAKLEYTLRHWMAQVSMRILELESRCAVIGIADSNPTLSANSSVLDIFGSGALQTRCSRPEWSDRP